MEKIVKLYSLSYSEARTYLLAVPFIACNILFPQILYLLPNGGSLFLPIYFFTLIGAYKFGLSVGLLTAMISPVTNHIIFGMPGEELLPVMIIKSVLLAIVAAYCARRFATFSLPLLFLVVLSYQIPGTIIEAGFFTGGFTALRELRLGIPGMALQIFGGYFALKALSRF